MTKDTFTKVTGITSKEYKIKKVCRGHYIATYKGWEIDCYDMRGYWSAEVLNHENEWNSIAEVLTLYKEYCLTLYDMLCGVFTNIDTL